MIQHIFLDLDDTIFDFKKAERIALSRTLREEGIKPTEQILNRYSEINLSQWKLLELGKLTREEVLVRRYEILFQEVGMSCDAKKISEKYEDFLGEGHYFIHASKTGRKHIPTRLFKQAVSLSKQARAIEAALDGINQIGRAHV